MSDVKNDLPDDMKLLVGKTLCADENGGKILFTSIDFVAREFEGQVKHVLQLSGEARGYLLNPQNPDRGAEKLPQPVAVVVEQDTTRDAVIQLKNLSRALGLSEADAIDGSKEDWLLRFDEAAPDSVVPLLRDKGFFVKTTLKANWEKAARYNESPFYFNAFSVAAREPASSDKIAEILKALKAKHSGAAVEGIA